MEICDGYGWDDETQKLEKQLRELENPEYEIPHLIEARVERERQKYREKLRKKIRKYGAEPCL